MTDRLLTVGEAASELGVSVKTLRRRIDEGALPTFRDGRITRVRRVDLDRYVAERVQRRVEAGRPVSAGSRLAPRERLWD